MINRDEIWKIIEPLVIAAITPRAASLSAALLDIPNLQAAWLPQAAYIGSGATIIQPDILAGHDLSPNNAPTLGVYQWSKGMEVGYWRLATASSQSLSRASETALALTANFTWGSWFNAQPTMVNAGLMAKGADAFANRCWATLISGGAIRADVYDGAGTQYPVTSTVTPSISQWYFVQARFIASTELSVFVNSTKTSLSTGLPAITLTNAAEFALGKLDNSFYMDGLLGAAYVSASALSDQSMLTIYHRMKAFYGL